ncbi:pyruvate kinase [Chloroflexota bacterium]
MKRIIVTVGPSLFQNIHLKDIHEEYYIYRINGAHDNVEGVEEQIQRIRKELPGAEILVDLPGNKVRTSNLDRPIKLAAGQKFTLSNGQINFADFYKYLKAGDVILASDSTLTFIVESASEKEISLTSKYEGQLFSNKGLHVRSVYKDIPFLFPKDKELIRMSNKHRIDYIGLSFVRTVEDINSAGELIDSAITIISKVETKAAVDNLNGILEAVDFILIDRGDLSTDVGLEKVPSYQRFIIEKAHFHNKNVFLSTQFLKNMEDKPVPSIAEIIDLYNTFKMGVYGIQLSEETSIGRYPGECLDVIKRIQNEINTELR